MVSLLHDCRPVMASNLTDLDLDLVMMTPAGCRRVKVAGAAVDLARLTAETALSYRSSVVRVNRTNILRHTITDNILQLYWLM